MFELHERLAADTLELARWPLCRVLLMKDAQYPWLILVPARADVMDMDQLDAADRQQLMDEITRASAALRAVFSPFKLNVGALGNMVAQLHIHVIARNPGDAAWPGPVWGARPPLAYDDADLQKTADRLRRALA